MNSEELRANWLKGTTCALRRKDVREIVFSSPTHIVLLHRSHSEYCGRWTGTKNCSSYALLYEVGTLLKAINRYGGMHSGALLKWEGRISRERIKAECAGIGVAFPGVNETAAGDA